MSLRRCAACSAEKQKEIVFTDSCFITYLIKGLQKRSFYVISLASRLKKRLLRGSNLPYSAAFFTPAASFAPEQSAGSLSS